MSEHSTDEGMHQGTDTSAANASPVPQTDSQLRARVPQGNQEPTAPVPQRDQLPEIDPDVKMMMEALAAAVAEAPPLKPLDMTAVSLTELLDSSYSGVICYDMFGRTVFTSARACEISGYSWEERLGRPGYELVHPDDLQAASESWLTLLMNPGEPTRVEQRIIRPDGEIIWVEAQMKNLIGIEPINGVVCHYHEITERKRAYAALHDSEQRQRDLAHRDHLTGLLNRRAISAKLKDAAEGARRGEDGEFAFLYVDLDGFKKVNDRLGHAFGDDYLRETARRLMAVAGDDASVARMGGDEFAILAEHVSDRQAALALGHRIVHAMTDPVKIRGNLVQLPACVGIVTSGGRGWEPGEYLQFADTALYAAKREGTGRVHLFDESLERHLLEQTTLASELVHALENNEFELLYQPIVSIHSRQVVGLEALICWNHPTRGLLRAGAFIEAAEETGLVIPMGEWVFDRVCREASAWRKTFGRKAPWVSCNLAAAQLIRQDFPAIVRDTITRHQVEPGLVRFELTERGLFETEGPWRDRLWEAQSAGVPLMLDDFGTGYTSLRYLSEFPVSVLKLDREYVARTDATDPGRRARGNALMRAVSAMSSSLGLTVIAEGIETEAQHRAAIEAGATLGQGWLYARAMPADQVADRLNEDGWAY